ncbi:ciliated left-right organizer metallopeptidase-like [Haliotis cracherodii]|uniref:ciliated left-right organizer metallopeptidase-like n=1 Tax=Haliotis cracherodii TaxID=6455 RepID=UPI0039E98A2F
MWTSPVQKMASLYQIQTPSFKTDTVFCFVIIFIFIWPSVYMHCWHDFVQEDIVDSTYLEYENDQDLSFHPGNYDIGRNKRASKNQYRSIRIKPYFEKGLFGDEVDALKDIIDRAIQKTSQILSVKPVVGPLLLSRTPCTKTWPSGINKGKCSQLDGIKQDYCMDYFKIPKSHLRGYSIYSGKSQSVPSHHEPDGAGIEKADYVLYVTAQITSVCTGSGDTVLAYASYCRVDQTDRPVAGHVNFCPSTLRRFGFNKEKIYWSALHEIFHALGFSKKLFNKYRKCNENGLNCTVHPSPVLRLEDNVMRLVTPQVKRIAQEHFHCLDKTDYGGPMDIRNTSHWDSRTMQGSIMAAKQGMPHLTFIDSITLALFEDSGWYKVDYSQADVYLWGRGAGCSFGLPSHCKYEVEYFCQQRAPGCHFLHWDKAKCSTNPHLTPCRVFESEPGDECWKVPSTDPSNITLEVFSKDSRCFLSNISKSEGAPPVLTPRCFHAHCYDRNLMVRVDNSSWMRCPPGTLLEIPGYVGSVKCPSHAARICSSVPRPLTSTQATTTTQIAHTVPYITHRASTTAENSGQSSSGTLCSSATVAAIILVSLQLPHTLPT